MYQITYKKKNGVIFNRVRNTIPGEIGEETSMGWLILDIKYYFNKNYYSFEEYKQLCSKRRTFNKVTRKINQFFKKYSTTLGLIVLIPLYLFK